GSATGRWLLPGVGPGNALIARRDPTRAILTRSPSPSPGGLTGPRPPTAPARYGRRPAGVGGRPPPAPNGRRGLALSSIGVSSPPGRPGQLLAVHRSMPVLATGRGCATSSRLPACPPNCAPAPATTSSASPTPVATAAPSSATFPVVRPGRHRRPEPPIPTNSPFSADPSPWESQEPRRDVHPPTQPQERPVRAGNAPSAFRFPGHKDLQVAAATCVGGVANDAGGRQSWVVVANLATVSDPNYTLREVTDDALAYYLRQGEAPGRWVGSGAARLGLAGEVAPAELRDLFAGKDPRTGTYLTSGKGSTGRAAARAAEVSVDVRAAAARLGVAEDTVRARLRAGTLDGEKVGGRWRVSAASIDAVMAGAVAGGLSVSVGPDGCWSLAQAAKVAGVHRSYFKRIVTDAVPELKAEGGPAQYLVGANDERGRWRVEPAEVRRFMRERQPARVVPVYDLVLRAPKSVALLHALAPLLAP